MKPVGQRTVIDHGMPADEDAVLMHETFDLAADYQAMSPVHIPRGFTKAYIAGEVVEDLGARIVTARDSFRDGFDMLLIEGTGHAGVGAVIGLSNAVVARHARCAGDHRQRGRRRPADRRDRPQRVALRAPRRRGRRRDRQQGRPGRPAGDRRGPASAASRSHGIRAPRASSRSGRSCRTRPWGWSSRASTARRPDPGPDLDRVIDGVAIGAMEPRHMLERVGPGTLVIVPGDREDVILTLTTAHLARRFRVAGAAEAAQIAQIAGRGDERADRDVDGHEGAAIGLVLTGGYRPRAARHRRDPPGRPLRDARRARTRTRSRPRSTTCS